MPIRWASTLPAPGCIHRPGGLFFGEMQGQGWEQVDVTTETGDTGGRGLVDGRISSENGPLSRRNPVRARELQRLDRDARAYVSVNPGGLGVVTHGVGPNPSHSGGGRRGRIVGFSKESRRRMVRRLARIDWGANTCFFTTLTVPDSVVGVDASTYKKWLKNWIQRLQYRYDRNLKGVLWRQEWVPRRSGQHIGAMVAHFHCVLFFEGGGPMLGSLRYFAGKSWAGVVRSGDDRHERVGTSVVKARNVRGEKLGRLMAYLSKYLGKLRENTVVDTRTGEVINCGRQWGVTGDVPMVTIATISMTWATYLEFVKRIREWGQSVNSWYLTAINHNWKGYLLMGDGLALLQRLTEGLDITFLPCKGASIDELALAA